MKFCTNCGEKLEDDARWCSRCGKQVMQPVEHPTVQVMQPVEQTTVQIMQPVEQSTVQAMQPEGQPQNVSQPQGNFSYGMTQNGQSMPENRPVKKSGKPAVIALITVIVAAVVIVGIIAITGVLKKDNNAKATTKNIVDNSSNNSSDNSSNENGNNSETGNITDNTDTTDNADDSGDNTSLTGIKVTDIEENSNDTYMGAFKLYMDALSEEDNKTIIEDMVIIEHRKGNEEELSKALKYIKSVYDVDNPVVEDVAIVSVKTEKNCGNAIIMDYLIARLEGKWDVCYDEIRLDKTYITINSDEIKAKQSTYVGAVELWVESIEERDYGKFASVMLIDKQTVEEYKENMGYEEAAMVYNYLGWIHEIGEARITYEEKNVGEGDLEECKIAFSYLGNVTDVAAVEMSCKVGDKAMSTGLLVVQIDGLWYTIDG